MEPPVRSQRRNAYTLPLSVEFVLATSLYWAVSASGLVALALHTDRSVVAVPVAVYAALVSAFAILHGACTLTDVSQAGGGCGSRWLPAPPPTRRCRVCGKSVPGLDHHCSWLGNCIGTRTYAAFLALVLVGTMQFVWHCAAVALVLAPVWRRQGAATVGATIFLAVTCAMGVVALFTFASLFAFHMYLLTRGKGTYDWLLERAEAEQRRAQAPPP
jgi:hypothetical protein